VTFAFLVHGLPPEKAAKARARVLREHPSPRTAGEEASSYSGQPAPGDGWSIRSASGGVLTGTK
jgi:hypothetical protein